MSRRVTPRCPSFQTSQHLDAEPKEMAAVRGQCGAQPGAACVLGPGLGRQGGLWEAGWGNQP